MAEKYKNKYRIPSAGLSYWDYGSNGLYFITICTAKHINFFGKIDNNQMHLNETGQITGRFWREIPAHFDFVNLDYFIIMPNHIHGILQIAKPEKLPEKKIDIVGRDVACNVSKIDYHINEFSERDVACYVSTSKQQIDSIDKKKNPVNPKNEDMSKISPKIGSISSVVRSYKSAVTKHARRITPNFAWQPRFYDHIIRNEKSLENIRHYIINNPLNWKDDEYYK